MTSASSSARPDRRSPPPSNGSASPPRNASPSQMAPKQGKYPARRNPPSDHPPSDHPPVDRPPAASRSAAAPQRSRSRSSGNRPEPKILFQQYFKSVGPRTYAAQLKQASNGNHFVVLTEGKRDPETGEVKKISLYVYSEDFVSYFKLIKATADFIKANPVSDEVQRRQAAYWKRHNENAACDRPDDRSPRSPSERKPIRQTNPNEANRTQHKPPFLKRQT